MLFLLNEKQQVLGIASNDNPGALPYFEDRLTESIESGVVSFEFAVPVQHEDAEYVVTNNHVIVRDLDGELRLFTIKEVEESRSGDGLIKRAYCENTAVSELISKVVKPQTINSATLAQAAREFMQEAPQWSLKVTALSTVKDVKIDNYVTLLEALTDTVKDFEHEMYFTVEMNGMKISRKWVHIVPKRGINTGVRFEYAKNLAGVTRKEDSSGVVTAMYGIGRDSGGTDGKRLTLLDAPAYNQDGFVKSNGVEYITSNDALKRWSQDGRHIFGIYYSDSADTPQQLFTETLGQLKQRVNPLMTYTTNVNLLERITGFEANKVRIGDYVTVIDRTFKPELMLSARVIELTRSLSDATQDTVKLGEYRPIKPAISKLVQKLADSALQQKDVGYIKDGIAAGIIEEHIKPIDSILDQHKDVIAELEANIDAGNTKVVEIEEIMKDLQNQFEEIEPVIREVPIFKQATAPENPKVDTLWLNTTTGILSRWTGTGWAVIGPDPKAIDDKIKAVDEKISTSIAASEERIKATTDALQEDLAEKVDGEWVNGQLQSKANAADTFTKTEVTNQLNAKVSTTTYTTDKNGIVSDLKSQESRITQSEKDILLKVADSTYQAGVKGLGDRLTTAESTLSVQAGQISAKINATEVYKKTEIDPKLNAKVEVKTYTDKIAAIEAAANAITLRVGTAEQGVTTVTNKLGEKVDTTTYNAKVGEIKVTTDTIATNVSNVSKKVDGQETRLKTAETSITQQDAAIKLKAESSEVYKKGEVDTKVDGIIVGGRNYALNGAKEIVFTNTAVTDNKGEALKVSDDGLNDFRGKQLVLSFDVETTNLVHGTASNNSVGIELRVEYVDGTTSWFEACYGKLVPAGTKQYTRYERRTAVVADKAIKALSLTVLHRSASGTVKLKNMQIEIGNKSTSFMPAFEDTVAAIDGINPGGRQFLRNANYAVYNTNDSIGWDKTLNGNLNISYWGTGYNSGVTDPTKGYHAHLDIKTFGFPVLAYHNKNASIGQPKRWLGLSGQFAEGFKTEAKQGDTVTVSMDIWADVAGVIIDGGPYHFIEGAANQTFHSGTYDFRPTELKKWVRYSHTFKLHDKFDIAKVGTFYIYGNKGAEGSAYVRNVKWEVGNKATPFTVSPEDTDAAIATKVPFQDFTNKVAEIKTTTDEITQSVESVRKTVGSSGNNILMNSGWFKDTSNWNLAAGVARSATLEFEGFPVITNTQSGLTTDSWRGAIHQRMPVSKGKTYTASVYVYTPNKDNFEGGALEVRCYDKAGTRVTGHTFAADLRQTVNNTWERRSVTFTITNASVVECDFVPWIKRNGQQYYAKPQLETGDVLTPWSPNETDRFLSMYEQKMAEIKTTTDGIEQKVTSVTNTATSQGQRLTTAEATIQTQATQISQRVATTTYNTDQNALKARVTTAETFINQNSSNILMLAKADGVGSMLNQSPDGFKIAGKYINLTGLVTFSTFDAATQAQINGIDTKAADGVAKANAAQGTANTANSNATNAKSKTDAWTINSTWINGDKIYAGTVTTAKLNVNEIFGNSAVIGKIQTIDFSADRIKGGIIRGIKYESINTTNASLKLVLENNTLKSFGALSGGKQDYTEIKDGGISVFQVAESGSPFGDLKSTVGPAYFNATVGSRSGALDATEVRFWVPNQLARVAYDVTKHNDSGYGLRLEAPGGVQIVSSDNNKGALGFEAQGSIFFDGWGNIKGDPYGAQNSTWSVKDGGGRVKFLIPVGTNGGGPTEIHSHGSGLDYLYNGYRFMSFWGDATNRVIRFGDGGQFKYQKAQGRFEFRSFDDGGWANAAAGTFTNASSLAWKTNIKNYEESALVLIANTDVMTYHYKADVKEAQAAPAEGEEVKEAPLHVGVISEYAPDLITNDDKSGVDLYAMISVAWKAIQELKEENEKLKEALTALRSA